MAHGRLCDSFTHFAVAGVGVGSKDLKIITVGDLEEADVPGFLRMMRPSLTNEDLSKDNLRRIFEVGS